MAEDFKKEYYFISALSGSISKSSEIWLVDNGASRHMTGYRSALTDLSERVSSQTVELGDDYTYATSFQLDSREVLHINDILYVPGLKKNLLSTSALEDKGFRVAFVDGRVLVWSKNSNIDSTRVIGV
jgi:hypothetical protein